MVVTLYSTHCPKCKVLESKLKAKQIDFKVVDDVNLMLEKGFQSAPMLELQDTKEQVTLDFNNARKLVDKYENVSSNFADFVRTQVIL